MRTTRNDGACPLFKGGVSRLIPARDHALSYARMTMEDRIIFVVGNSRSGTTMMGRILGNHGRVFTFHELHFFEQMWSRGDRDRLLSRSECLNTLSRLLCAQRDGYFAQCEKKYSSYLEEAGTIADASQSQAAPLEVLRMFMSYEAARNGKSIPCEQTPRNVFYLKEILEFFPGARIVNMVRDPRDVLLSQKRRWKRPFLSGQKVPRSQAIRYWVNYHPITISKLWNSSLRAADSCAADDRIYTLRFEDLVSNPDHHVRRLCDFIGIGYEEAMLRVPMIGSSSSHDDPETTGIDREKTGFWHGGGLNSSELCILEWITAPYMAKHGYERSAMRANPFVLLFYLISFPFKITAAFLLSLRRMKNITEAIKRRLQ